MLLDARSLNGEKSGRVKLPQQFCESIRTDLIQRAVETVWSRNRQSYGADPEAGKRQVSWLSKRRRDYKATYGKGQSRVPRKTLAHRGTWFHHVAAFAPGTVGGRAAHPPKAERVWEKKLNVKERRKALRSALSATMSKDFVLHRGHKIPQEYPFILDDAFESLKKTSDVEKALLALGFSEELSRVSPSFRAGRGKRRGRARRVPKSLLLVTRGECALSRSARNIPGIDVIDAQHVNIVLLAPGSHPGRASLFTKGAVDEFEKKRLFL